MTEEGKKLLDSLEKEVRYLLFLYGKLQEENALLRKDLSEKDAELSDLEVRYAALKSARIISVHDSELRDTKQRLTRLVREVDKCIALLSE